MKILILSIALFCGHFSYAQNEPLTVRFLPVFSSGKSKGSQTEAHVGNSGYTKSQKESSKTIKTKNVMRFGEYTVSGVSFKNEEVEIAASYFLKYVNSKIQSNGFFTVKTASKQAIVKTSDNVKVEGIGKSTWTDLLIPFKARLVSTGVIKIDTSTFEYLIEDNNFINNSSEETVGFLTNGNNKIAIKLHKRVLSFYESDKKIGELKFPLLKDSTIWLSDTLNADTQLAISAICSAALFKIRGINENN
jgi:hypothetical protein